MASGKTAVFPGVFDPVTNGHLDIVQRALGLFPRVVVAAAADSGKTPRFTLDERSELLRSCCEKWGERVEVVSFSGLLVDFMNLHKYTVIVRGLRAVADYEYELQMARMNRYLSPMVDTVFLPAGDNASCISSSLIKQVSHLGGDISQFVPEVVAEALRKTP